MLLDESTTARTTPEEVWRSIAQFAEQRGLSAGEQLPGVRDLADHLGAKPTLVRDALLHGQACGAVRIVPRVGAFLLSPSRTANGGLEGSLVPPAFAKGSDEDNVLHLLDARRLIEVELVGRLAKNHRLEDLLPVRRTLEAMLQMPEDGKRDEYVDLDMRFHVALARLAGNEVLAGILEALIQRLHPFIDVPWTRDLRVLADRSHAAVYKAIVERDVAQARHEMELHLKQGYDLLLAELRHVPQGGALSKGNGNGHGASAAPRIGRSNGNGHKR